MSHDFRLENTNAHSVPSPHLVVRATGLAHPKRFTLAILSLQEGNPPEKGESKGGKGEGVRGQMKMRRGRGEREGRREGSTEERGEGKRGRVNGRGEGK